MNTFHKLRVGVIVGGRPEELNDAICTAHEVSKSLENLGSHVEIITFDDRFKKAIIYAKIDLAFIVDATYLGKTKNKRSLRATLEKLKIPYTGSKIKASSITKNKSLSKTYFKKAGLLTPKHIEISSKNLTKLKKKLLEEKLEPPFVVKPRDEGSGIDVIFVKNIEKTVETSKELLVRYKDIIIEQYMKGIELTIPVLEMNRKVVALAVIEIEKSIPVLSNEVKSLLTFSPKQESEKILRYYIPARMREDIIKKAGQMAINVHQAIGCRGYSRIDMIVDKQNRIWVLEINSLPTLCNDDFFSMATKYKGLSYDKVVESIITSSLNKK
ncbi:MAG: ATP-grasp domain-containing protein [Patescibacteria group bacterium]